MKWPWRQADGADQKALEESQAKLKKIRDQWPAVHEAAATMRRHRERNGFTEAIRTAMGVRR